MAPAVDWTAATQIHHYRQAANPIRPGLTQPIPLKQWPADQLFQGGSGIEPLDLSTELGMDRAATSPALAAHAVRILKNEQVRANALATSSLFVVIQGHGQLHGEEGNGRPCLDLAWDAGDVIVLPGGPGVTLSAGETSSLFWVHDGPLLTYLGIEQVRPRFSPTHYRAAVLEAELQQLLRDPSAAQSNRLSLLLGNRAMASTRTVTHTLWAMLGLVPAGVTQPPHRHQSVAIDLILDCDPGCYTLVGKDLDANGLILNPKRIHWESGGVFLTPPGLWHSHVNGSQRTARLMPVQDAGPHTYLRSLDIRFAAGHVETG